MADPRTDDAPKPADSRKDEKLVKLRPTLFVAIGGTGMEVLMRLRRRTLNALWGSGVRVESLADFPVAQFVQFDLDQGAVIESGRAAALGTSIPWSTWSVALAIGLAAAILGYAFFQHSRDEFADAL